MLDIESMIVAKWNELPANARSVRSVQAALAADGITVGRTSVHKAITAHKRGIAREIVVEEADKAGQALAEAAEVATTPEAQDMVREATGNALAHVDRFVQAFCRAGTYALEAQGQAGVRPTSVADLASMADSTAKLVTALTAAHEVQQKLQANRDELDRRFAPDPGAPPPHRPADTTLARTLRAIHSGEVQQ